MDKRPRKDYHRGVPQVDVRYDCYNHFPVVVDSTKRTSCKFEECKQHTSWKCSKCNVFLCLTNKRNCFSEFHRPPNSNQ